MFEELFHKKIIFVSGKGGTGKSLFSVFLAFQAAERGKRVLLAEAHAFDKLAPLMGRKAIGHHETIISDRVSCINLDPKRCFAEYVILHLGMENLYERVFKTKAVKSLLDAIPGLDETMLLGRLFHTCELSEDQKYDLVIFDSPASGHFLNLFTTPDAIIDTGLVGPLVKEVQRVKEFISDPEKSAGVLMSLPETLVMTETLEFLHYFGDKIPLHLSAVILNKFCSLLDAQFTPHTQKFFERKRGESLKACEKLLKLKSKSFEKLYTFPDMHFIQEPVLEDRCKALAPFVKDMNDA